MEVRAHSGPGISLIQDIQHIILLMNADFKKAFSEGQAHPESEEISLKSELFDEIWQFLDGPRASAIEFPSIQDLDKYYDKFTFNLPEYINDFCRRKDILTENISNNKRVMLAQLCSLYHVLYRLSYLLAQFQPGDEPDNLSIYTGDIKKNHEHATDIADGIAVFPCEQFIQLANHIFSVIELNLKTEGYLKKPLRFDSSSLHDVDFVIRTDRGLINLNEYVVQVKKSLQSLPTNRDMVASTERFKQARREKNEAEIVNLKTEIRKFIRQLLTIKDELESIISKLFILYDQKFEEMANKLKRFNDTFEAIKVHARLLDIQRIFNELNGNDLDKVNYTLVLTEQAANIRATCAMQSPAEKWSLGFWGNDWQLAGKQVGGEVDLLARKLSTFMSQYADYQEILNNQSLLKQKKDSLLELHNRMKSVRTLTKTTWEEAQSAIDVITSETLKSWLDVPQNTIQHLLKSLKDNVLEMGIGTSAGGAGGALLAFGLSLGPAGIAAVASLLALAGGAGGLGLGVAISQKNNEEKQPLLQDGPPPSYGASSHTIWPKPERSLNAEPATPANRR